MGQLEVISEVARYTPITVCSLYSGLIDSIRLLPQSFQSTTPINSRVQGCEVEVRGNFFCLSGTILNDGNLGPDPSDITNTTNNNQFAAWQDGNVDPYISVDITQTFVVSAIDLYVLNYPAENIGMPNFQLYETGDSVWWIQIMLAVPLYQQSQLTC